MQGQGLNIGLSGTITFGASGITSAFNAVPDVPITSFVLDLPQGPHSALSASKGLCGGALTMPTTIVGQNGARLQRKTPISVTGCGIKILRARVKKGTVMLTVQVSQPASSPRRARACAREQAVTKGGNVKLKCGCRRSARAAAQRHRAQAPEGQGHACASARSGAPAVTFKSVRRSGSRRRGTQGVEPHVARRSRGSSAPSAARDIALSAIATAMRDEDEVEDERVHSDQGDGNRGPHIGHTADLVSSCSGWPKYPKVVIGHVAK